MRPRTAASNPDHELDVRTQVDLYLTDLTHEWPGITHENVWSLTWTQWLMYRRQVDLLREKARADRG